MISRLRFDKSFRAINLVFTVKNGKRFWVLLLGGCSILGTFIAVISFVRPLDRTPDEYLGIWQVDYTERVAIGGDKEFEIRTIGTAEFIDTGNYNFTGEISYITEIEDVAFKVNYIVSIAGTWSGTNSELVTTIVDAKSTHLASLVDGVPISSVVDDWENDSVNIGKEINRGASVAYHILNVSENEISSYRVGLTQVRIDVSLVRVQQHYNALANLNY